MITLEACRDAGLKSIQFYFVLQSLLQNRAPAGDIVHLVVDAVELMDVSAFEAEHRVGGAGQAPFDPKVLLALLIYAYALRTILGPLYGARKGTGIKVKISRTRL